MHEWHKCPKPLRGYETFYRDQYFRIATYNGGISYSLSTTRNKERRGDGMRHFIGSFCCTCAKCGYNKNVAVREFKPTNLTRTQYTNWTQCAFGHCDRLTFRINGYDRLFWAEYDPKKRKVAIFGSHRSLRPIGHVSVSLVPQDIRKALRDSKKDP